MDAPLFDQRLRRLRRDRAFRLGGDAFLHQRAFEDVVERLELVRQRFGSALLVGCFDPQWPERLLSFADRVDVIDPGALFAGTASGKCSDEAAMDLTPASYDLCVAIGTLDTANDLQRALLLIRFALRESSLFVGALTGGDSLPQLRSAMRAADEVMGAASPHVHPRIDPPGLAGLLTECGFRDAVVDIDRVQVSYRSLFDLVRDLRAMGATNVLAQRSRRPLSRGAVSAAADRFLQDAKDGRVTERFELLHFAAWTPASDG